jgi:hypothetical protein
MFSFPRLPPHDRGRRRLACQWSTVWSGAQCHPTLGCAAARLSHPAHATAGRPPVRSSPLSFYQPATPPSVYLCSHSEPPSPSTHWQVPHSNSPCHHSVALFPQPSLIVAERGHATRVVLSHTRAARSSLPGRARVHRRLLCEERNYRDTASSTTYTA